MPAVVVSMVMGVSVYIGFTCHIAGRLALKPEEPDSTARQGTDHYVGIGGSHFQAASEANAATVQATSTLGDCLPPRAMASRKQRGPCPAPGIWDSAKTPK